MTTTVAMCVTDAKKNSVVAAINALTPTYTIGFIRPCIPTTTENPTSETPPTHWYNNSSMVPVEVVQAWVSAVDAAEENDALFGLKHFVGQNIDNAIEWAVTNLTSQGLMFVPDEE